MKQFPKKYKPQDLRNWAKNFRNSEPDNNHTTFNINLIPTSNKLSYKDFFLIYLRDFFNYKQNIKSKWDQDTSNNHYENLFLISNDQLQNICSSYNFFSKKWQTLPQVWVNKLERRILSLSKKNLNANNKILESYLSSPHKIYITDTEMYLYIIQQFKRLRQDWKISQRTEIWYRSFNLQTSIPSQNISWKEESTPYYVLKYFVGAKCEALPVYVEDIDTCCGDVALLVHPKDKRYNKYIWKKAIIPLCNRQIPIIWDENVNIALNNWIKRICPCSDQESIELAIKYWLPTNIYAFNQKWLYTEYIHEPAFIWQERSKYYNNIVWFIEDIWNLANKWEVTTKIPYLEQTEERLVPYKIDNLVIDLKEQKKEIIQEILEKKLDFSFIKNDFSLLFKEIDSLNEKIDLITNQNLLNNDEEHIIDGNEEEIDTNNTYNDKIEKLQTEVTQLKQQVIDEISKYLPDSMICNIQLPYWRRIPLIKNSKWELSFFDIEDQCLRWKSKPLQTCFDFILLSLIRDWTLWIKKFSNKDDEQKLCEYEKFSTILLQNEKKIQHFVQHLSTITGEKTEYEKFLQMINNLPENNKQTTDELHKLIQNSQFLTQEWTWLSLNISWISNDMIDPYFVQLCTPCYLYDKNIKLDNQLIHNFDERSDVFQQLAIQKLLLWNSISHKFLEYSYNEDEEFLLNKDLSKLQIEQSQWDLFALYWENPIRLSFIVNETYNQKEILLNNIFLKQIWNAVRLCIQKDFLPKNIEECLNKQPNDFENFDISILSKLNEIYTYLQDVQTYEQYIRFFNSFKRAVQDIFFSWYLEILKVHSTKNAKFVCAYFFNFLLTMLYPIVPEFVDALQYISEKKFILPIKPVELNKTMDYNMNVLYDTFIKIKNIKIECNIKQHEVCNIFIKSNPSIWEFFMENEQIFKNYFHISDILYLRLHEQTPLWYEIFSDDTISIGMQSNNLSITKEKDSIETLEIDIKNLEDKLNLLRQRIQFLPAWEQRSMVEEEYARTKEEMENLTIKYSLLSSK